MSEFLEAALAHAKDGWRVFPVEPKGKRPLIKDNLNRATRSEEQIREWWEQYPDANIGGVAGDGIAVLDVDKRNGGNETLNRLVKEKAEGGAVPNTKIVRTGGGGFHFYFRDDPDAPLPKSTGKIGPGLDLQASGKGYVVLPPSIHPSGERYENHNQATMVEVWPWLRAKAFEAAGPQPKPANAEYEYETFGAGERNNGLAKIAGRYRRQGMDPDVLENTLLMENQKRCKPPLPEEEVLAIARSVGRYDPSPDDAPEDIFEADPDSVPEPGVAPASRETDDEYIYLSDEWVAKEVTPKSERLARWVPDLGLWLVWKDHKWEEDHSDQAKRIVRKYIRRVAVWCRGRAEQAPTEDQGSPYMTAAERIQKAGVIKGLISLVQNDTALDIRDFDRDPAALNTPKGVVNLRTGEITQAEDRENHLFRLSTAVAPEPGTPKIWLKFLRDLTGGDEDFIRYIQRYGGYCLTGYMSEKTFWNIWGANTDTGKSTFISILSSIWGDYAKTVDPAVLMKPGKKDDSAAALAQLAGARLVTATEPAAGEVWSEKKIKAITGGDEIQARALYGQPFTYDPQFKIMVAGNKEPEMEHVDEAMLRRVRIVPFNRKVPKDKKVLELDRKLVEREGPQILNWFIEGAVDWFREGLETPAVVQVRTEQYGSNEDMVLQWVTEKCELNEEAARPTNVTSELESFRETREDLYTSWSRWCKVRHHDPGSFKGFKGLMESKDLPIRDALVGENRARGFWGIRLKDTKVGINFD